MKRARFFSLATIVIGAMVACGQTDTSDDSSSGGDASTGDASISDGAITDAIISDDGPHVLADGGEIAAPRLVSPLDTATVSSQKPTIHWVLPPNVTGAHVEICKDRACTNIETSFDAIGSSGAPPSALAPGVHFFRVGGHVGSSIGNPRSATWEMMVGHRSAAHDSSWGGFPDFNGDGLADVMAAGGPNNGSYDVEIFPGNRLGPSNATAVYVKDPSRQADDNFPRGTFGDVDGDGFTDLVVGNITTTASKDQNNRISIYRGNAAGFTAASTPTWIVHVPPAAVDGGDEYTGFGGTVTVPGDVNGDGYADILASTTLGANVYGPTLVFFGHANGPSKTPDAVLDGVPLAYEMYPAGPVGDMDGDGYTDVVLTCQAGYGAFWFAGGPSGPSDATRRTIVQPASAVSGEFERVMNGAGDLDGDGLPDLAISALIAPRGDDGSVGAGQVYIYRGESGPGLVSADWTLTGPDADNGNFGGASSIAGDIDGDGYDDLVVGAPFISSNDGRAYYFRGSASGVSDGVRVTLTGPGGGGYFGGAAQAGDLDGDGYADAIVASSLGGVLTIFYGGASGMSNSSTQTTLNTPGFVYILAESSPLAKFLRGPT